MKTPALIDYNLILQAGIDPKTGLSLKASRTRRNSALKSDVKRFLRIIDEQDAVGRYTWYNLPAGISSQELERLLYYKGQLCFFLEKSTNTFYFMPYALDGTIDFYGRFNTVHPVPITDGTEKDGQNDKLKEFLSTIKLECVYGLNLGDSSDDIYGKCVLLHDYTKQLSQTIINRSELNDHLLDVMAECIPYMQTSLLLATGINGVRVADADQEASVKDGSDSLANAALNQQPWIPIIGKVDFQQLTPGQVAKAEEFMLAMQSLDNLRLSGYGIDNGGLFEKKAHELNAEAAINGTPIGLVLQDGLSIRQNFCDIVNSIWGLGIWCEISQPINNIPSIEGGMPYEENEQGENSGIEPDKGEPVNVDSE